MNWMGTFDVNFWSVDCSGNVEDKNKPDNSIVIRIDAQRPYVEITEPADEQQLNLPFWVRATASDNAVVDRVEFDIEPFGQNPGLPYVDSTPPYEWLCNISEMGIASNDPGDGQPLGVNKMVRARVFDGSGQVWTHEVWVFIKNAGSYSKKFLIGFFRDKTVNGSLVTINPRCIFSLTIDTMQPALLFSGNQFTILMDNSVGYIGGPLKGMIGVFDIVVEAG
jgi:hypothetical protein